MCLRTKASAVRIANTQGEKVAQFWASERYEDMASLQASWFLDAVPIYAVWLTGVTQSRVTAPSFLHNKASVTLVAIFPVVPQASTGASRLAISPIAATVEAATGQVGIGRDKKANNTCISLQTSAARRKTILESPTRPNPSLHRTYAKCRAGR